MLDDYHKEEQLPGYMRTAAPVNSTIPDQHTVATPYMVGPVHYYSTEQAGELVLFDTGPPTDAGRRHLQQNIDLSRLRHIIITHCHIDHFGQAAWLEQQSDARIYLPRLDIMKARNHEKRMAKMSELFLELGFKEPFLKQFHQSLKKGVLPSFPENYQVAETDIPAHLGIEVLSCPGHSQSDLIYRSRDWAISGDTLLRGIFQSPLLDVDLETGERFRNYRAYCTSIVKLAGLGELTVLPGHRTYIDSVEATILFYIRKILRRVRLLRPCGAGLCVAEIIDQLFPSMADPFHIYLKLSEIVFMQEFLEEPELLGDALAEIGLFERVAVEFDRVVT